VATAIYTILAAAPTSARPRYVLRSADGDAEHTTTGATIRYTTDGSAPTKPRSGLCGAVHGERHDPREGHRIR